VAKTLILFSFPFMLSTLLQTLYSTTDTIVVGQYLGSAGLSAVSNGSQLMQMLYMICVGFSTAGQVLISQAQGAHDQLKVQRVVGTLCVLEVLLSAFLGALCLIFNHSLLDLLNTPTEAYVQASHYISICSWGMIFTGLYNMFSAILRGMGNSKQPLIFVVIASVINIILDVLFIAVFHWNVAGAALATVIGQFVSVLFSIYYLYRHSADFNISFTLHDLIPHRATSLQIIQIGIPLAIQSAAVQFSFLFVSHMVNTLGITVSAAFGVAQKLRNIPGILTQALGLGASSMIGQNLGARRNDRVSSTVNWCLLFTTIINAAFGILFWFAPVFCFRIFTQDQTVLAYAFICIIALVVELPGKCVMPACNALVSAQGFVQFSMVVAFLDAFAGRVLCCWLFGIVMDLGALGFFLGYSAGTYLTAIPVFIYYLSGLWKRRATLS
jgi:putative MATE family efflux protein